MTTARICIALGLMLGLAGCGSTGVISNGQVGRQNTTNGLEKEIYKPGAFRLDSCVFSSCPQMIILQTGFSSEEIKVNTVFLPKSDVDLADVTLALQFHVKPDDNSINQVYRDVTSEPQKDGSSYISADELYRIYLKRIVPNIIIGVLRDYTVEEALSNVDQISAAALNAIHKQMADQPVEVTEVGFPNGVGRPPEQVLAAKRNLYVVKENITRQIKELEGSLDVEKQRQVVQQLRVTNDVHNSKIAGLNVNQYIFLKNMERFADEHVPLGFVPGLDLNEKQHEPAPEPVPAAPAPAAPAKKDQ